jgi:hypothetical protein
MQVGIVFLFLAPYAAAVVMPSWRWLLAYAVVVGGVLTVWFAGIATAPTRTGLEGIGLFYIVPIAVSTAAGTLIRTATLIMVVRGRSGVVAVSAAGLTIPMGILGAIIVWAIWESRPPSDACLRSTFPVELAGGHLSIPAAPIISMFLGPHPTRQEYNFAIPPALREFCALTEIGKHSIRANKISIRPGLAPYMTAMAAPAFCVSPAAWATGLCAEIDLARRFRPYESTLPYEVLVYSSDAETAAGVGGSASTNSNSPSTPTPLSGGVFVMTDSRTPDGNLLTFACRNGSDHKHLCTASYPWREGMFLAYEIRTDEANLSEKGKRVDAALQRFLEQLLVKNEN